MQSNSITLIANELRAFIRQHFKVPHDDPDFSDDIHLFDYGYVDSFGAVELTSFVEQKFALTVSQSDLVAFPMNTVNQIAKFVSDRVSQNT